MQTQNSPELDKRLEHALQVTLEGLKSSLYRHVPSSGYRDFYLWAISEDNPQQADYLQTVGISQLVNLTVTLLHDLVDDEKWPQMLDYTVTMNVYQIYEIISDNLAIGLSTTLAMDARQDLRQQLLIDFNNAMLKRLNGTSTPAAQLLTPLHPLAGRVSLFEQSLADQKQSIFAQAYLKQQCDVVLEDLEYAMWSPLVANIEACVDLVASIQTCHLSDLLRQGLVGRYRAVNHLLKAETLTMPQLADTGAYAILVIPTLAYYIAVLAEVLEPQPDFAKIVRDGTLEQTLYDAALLVRLLNDLGTNLLTLSAAERTDLMERLWTCYQEHSPDIQTFADLMRVADEPVLLTRIYKDISFGEFNVGIHNLINCPSIFKALLTFSDNLDYCCQLYERRRERFSHNVQLIDERFEQVAQIILRFVEFHQMLYSNQFDKSVGEYAI